MAEGNSGFDLDFLPREHEQKSSGLCRLGRRLDVLLLQTVSQVSQVVPILTHTSQVSKRETQREGKVVEWYCLRFIV